MNDTDRIYQLFAEANPAPASSVPTTERPDTDVILREQRTPTMLTREPKILEPQPSTPRLRRWRGPAIALASFIVAAGFGIAVWLVASNDGPDATNPTLPQFPTTVPTTTTLPTNVVPIVVSVPDLQGLTLADARQLLSEAGLEVVALPSDIESAIVVAQEPAPGADVDEGSIITVDVQVTPTCAPTAPTAPGAGQVNINVRFECDGDGLYPNIGIAVRRLVPEGDESIDRIEWTLRSLLAGPTAEERAAGFTSFFDQSTADALNSVTLTDGRVVADFNEAIYVNNASTSTGSIFFNAELRANLFQYPEVGSVEFRVNGDCEAWSAFFQSDGCWVITRAEWDQATAEWDELRN
jgi:hypothetical protein